MADDPTSSAPRTGSWWATLPGILTAAAAVITALSGLFAILAQNGILGEKNKAFVTQKAADVRDAVTPSTSSDTSDGPKTNLTNTPIESGGKTVVAASTATKDGAATGIASGPLHATPFTGAIVTQLNGAVTKLRDDITEWCQGAPVLKTTNGQLIEWKRLARFDVSDWNASSGKGKVHIVLNNGETIDTEVQECAIRGSNDLGDFKGDFETLRSVEFIR
jgi:hypothetical protein